VKLVLLIKERGTGVWVAIHLNRNKRDAKTIAQVLPLYLSFKYEIRKIISFL